MFKFLTCNIVVAMLVCPKQRCTAWITERKAVHGSQKAIAPQSFAASAIIVRRATALKSVWLNEYKKCIVYITSLLNDNDFLTLKIENLII